MTIHTTLIGHSTFYINRKAGQNNYNRVLANGRTFHYQSAAKYYKAIQRAKKQIFN